MANREEIKIEITSNTKEITKELEEIDKQIKALNKTKIELSVSLGELTEALKSLNNIESEIKSLSSQKAAIQVNYDSIDEANGKINGIESQLEALSKQKAGITVTTDDIEQAKKEIEDTEKALKDLDGRKAEVNVEKKTVEDVEKILNTILTKLDDVNDKKTNIKVNHNLDQIGNTLDSVGSKMLGVLNPFNSFVGSVVSSLSIFNLLDSAFSAISSSLDSAITRFDTLQKYPKVMSSLGHSTEAATASVNALSDGIDGLPTTLQDIVAQTQNFASITGDLEEATQLSIAFNNAALASGASTEQAGRAAQQYSKILSTGKVTLQTWTTLTETMPVSLTKVANAMGFTGKTAKTDLYDALNKGKVSVNDFNKSLIELGTGTGELAELARVNSEGIGTSLTNLKNTVSRNVANIITALDGVLEKVTGKNIAQTLDGIKGSVNSFFKLITDNIHLAEPFIELAIQKFEQFKNALAQIDWKSFLEGFKEGFAGLKTAFDNVKNFIKPITDFIKSLITQLGDGDFSKGLGKLPALYLKVAASLKVLGGGFKLLSKLKIPELFKKKTSGGGSGLTFNFDVGQLLTQVKNLALVYGVIVIIKNLAQALKEVNDKIPEDFSGLAKKLVNMGLVLVAVGALVVVAGKIASKDYTAAAAGLLAVALISVNLMIAAEAIAQVNRKVPQDIETFSKKVANIAIAIGSMLLLVTAATVVSKIGLPNFLAGLAAVGVICLELIVAAEAMKQVNDKVPDNIKEFAPKVANIALAITAMAGLVLAVGAVVATGIGGIAIAAGLVTVALVAGELVLVAEALSQFEKRVPNNLRDVQDKIGEISEIINYFNASNLGSILEVFENLIGAINVVVISAGIQAMIELANAINEFAEIEINEGVEENIRAIQRIMRVFDGADFQKLIDDAIGTIDVVLLKTTFEQLLELGYILKDFEQLEFDYDKVYWKVRDIQQILDLFKGADFGKLVADVIGTLDLSVAISAFKKFIKFGELFKQIEQLEFDYDGVRIKLVQLKIIINLFDGKTWNDLVESTFGLFDLSLAKKGIEKFLSFQDLLKEIEGLDLDLKLIDKKVRGIRTVIKQFEGAKFGQIIDDAFGAIDLNIVRNGFTQLKLIGEAIDKIAKLEFDNFSAIARINDIQMIIDTLSGDEGVLKKLGNLFKDSLDAGTLSSANESFANLVEIGNKLVELEKVQFDLATVKETVNAIKKVISLLGESNLKKLVSSLLKDSELKNVNKSITTIIGIAEKIEELQKINVAPTLAMARIEAITDVIGAIGGSDIETLVASVIKVSELKNIIKSIEKLKETAESINEFTQMPFDRYASLARIQEVLDILQELERFKKFEDIGQFNLIIESFKQLVYELATLNGDFDATGQGFGDALYDGWKKAKVESKIEKLINKLIRDLKQKKKKFTEIGEEYGNALREAFEKTTALMHMAIDKQITTLLSKTTQFATLGTTFGNSLSSSFASATSNLSTYVSNQVSAIQNSLNSLSVPTLEVDLTASGSTVYRHNGGLVGNYYSSGGEVGRASKQGASGAAGAFSQAIRNVFKPRGTDTIPSMLTKGEFVVKEPSVKSVGIPLLNDINKYGMKGIMKHMYHPYDTSHSMIYRNTYNYTTNNNSNINATINQNMSGKNGNYGMIRSTRALAGI